MPFPIQGQGYQNCRRMAIDTVVQQLCREEEVGFVDLWGFFVGRADMSTVNCGMGSIKNIFGNKRCLN